MARAAGLKKHAAQRIAYAAQYVDDSVAREIDDHEDGGKVIAIPTAHHPTNIRNLDRDHQRYIWVPFHFIPGGKGKTFTERLVCRKDSKIAKEMVNNNISQVECPYILELLGITAHVYGDTFSHYGFSGVSSRRNRVDGMSIKIDNPNTMVEEVLGEKLSDWFERHGEQGGLLTNIRAFVSGATEIASGALGHGAVSIYPDQPYLKWRFDYEYETMATPKDSIRNNPKTFLEGAEALHKMFSTFFAYSFDNSNLRDYTVKVDFSEIKDTVKEIISLEANKMERAEAWKAAAKKGLLYNKKEKIPEYDESIWNDEQDKFTNLKKSNDMARFGVYKFYQAASYHRHYVLRELLPKHSIIVV